MPADPAAVGAYLASLADTRAPSTICRRLSAIGKMHRLNDLPWDPAHPAVQEPLQRALHARARPVQTAAALAFGRGGAPGLSFEARAILIGIAFLCLLLLLSTLFWMVLKGALVLSAVLYFGARISAGGIGALAHRSARVDAASSPAHAFGAMRTPVFWLVAAGTVVAAVYVGAGIAILALGVCLGIVLGARLLPGP